MEFTMKAGGWLAIGTPAAEASPIARAFRNLGMVTYTAAIPSKNNSYQSLHGQMDFEIGKALGAKEFLPPKGAFQNSDLFFEYAGLKTVIEVERANHEKFLRDILKIHEYLTAGADFGVLMVPVQHAHSGGTPKHFKEAQKYVSRCRASGFWNPKFNDRFLLVGFEMFDGESDESYCTAVRSKYVERAKALYP